MYDIFYITMYFLYGIVIGSFLNVCIYRLPMKLSVAKGRSFCPSCNHTLKAIDLIPIASYLFLGRKCRYCKGKISARYCFVELLTGILFVAVYLKMAATWLSVIYCLAACVLVTLSFIDIDTKEIPDRMHIFILALCIPTIIIENNLASHLIGLVAVSVPMLIIAYFTGGFGGGDIKLMAVAGLLIGVYPVVFAFFAGAFFGALYGIYLLIAKKADRKAAFSFGPFLSVGIFVAMLYANDVISWYIGLF